MSLPFIALEASVLAIPIESAPSSEVHSYLLKLIDWSALLDDTPASVVISELATQAMFDSNRFPSVDRLDQLLRSRDIQEYDGRTISRMISRLLELTPSLEHATGLSSMLIDNFSASPDTALPLEGWAPLRTDHVNCLCHIALSASQPETVRSHLFVSSITTCSLTEVSFTLYDIDSTDSNRPLARELPAEISCAIPVASDTANAFSSFNAENIWLTAESDAELRFAIRCAIAQTSKAFGIKGPIRKFKFGRNFVASLRSLGALQSDRLAAKTLQAVALTVLMLRLPLTHALRTGSGPNDAQQRRGGDFAWRRDVDYEFHLHYWECSGNEVELAALVTHNDFSIPRT
ncbi:hypothetical protein ACQKGO_30255 [Corallococcus interemptor]|uniref:hypothetical protein n=1 Tax=Corallococcus interemptor TaxID=2316720 RepID=UPI003D067F93